MTGKCQRCKSDRVVRMALYLSPDDGDDSEYKGFRLHVSGLFETPESLFMGFCAECGQVQGRFPISERRILANCHEVEEEDTEYWDEESMSEREEELGIGKDDI